MCGFVQGARSILGGIQNLQLLSGVSVATLLIRQQGKLAPPLLTSTLQHSELVTSVPNQQQEDVATAAEAAAVSTAARSPARFSRQAASGFKVSAPSPTAASLLLSGRLNRQSRPQGSLPAALGVFGGSPNAAAAGFGRTDTAAVDVSAARPDHTAGQEGQEAAGTPGTMTQDEWNAFLQTGSKAPTLPIKAVSSRTAGRKKAVRPILKKQRINTYTDILD